LRDVILCYNANDLTVFNDHHPPRIFVDHPSSYVGYSVKRRTRYGRIHDFACRSDRPACFDDLVKRYPPCKLLTDDDQYLGRFHQMVDLAYRHCAATVVKVSSTALVT